MPWHDPTRNRGLNVGPRHGVSLRNDSLMEWICHGVVPTEQNIDVKDTPWCGPTGNSLGDMGCPKGLFKHFIRVPICRI